jgi:hypothetical protein
MFSSEKRNQTLVILIIATLLAVSLACGEGEEGLSTKTPRPTQGPTPTAISDITYDDLARFPEKYMGSKLELTGEVVQIIDQTNSRVELRANITRNDSFWEDDVYLYYSGDLPHRLLEDDIIHVYAFGRGLVEYKTVLGAKRTIPKLEIVKIIDIEQQE